MTLAFMSYQTADRHIAAGVAGFLNSLGIDTFMAHDDIEVSHEWQQVIFEQIGLANIFVAILSENYCKSYYCLQESGVAVFRRAAMTIIPLSIDGTISPGFMNSIQSRKYEPQTAGAEAVLFAGIAKYDRDFAIETMINRFGLSRSWAQAGRYLSLLKPYLVAATEGQIAEVLRAAAMNNEVTYSFDCRSTLIELLEKHGNLLDKEQSEYLRATWKL